MEVSGYFPLLTSVPMSMAVSILARTQTLVVSRGFSEGNWCDSRNLTGVC